ncbi:MAG: sulfatase-like hydrolase/transferase, partial [Terriglobales bacterium]
MPVLASLLVAAATAQAAVQPPVNLVVITIDTLRADRVGCYGYKAGETPNLDRLAAEGVRFERAYTPVPITLPSHAVIFTGTYPMYSGMHDFSGNTLSPQQPTLASILRQHGYATGAVLGSAVLDSRFGLNHGFDFYYDHFDFSRLQEANLDEMERPGNVVVDEALKWLKERGQKKFFLWVHLYDPHHPYHPPAPYSERHKAQPYDGEIAFADAQAGRVVSFLKARGLYQRTLLVVVGDHGEGLGEHGENTHGFFIYDSTLHIPLILKLPVGKNARPARVSTDVSTVDLLPTVLDALHLAAPAEVQGRSVLPLLRGKGAEGGELYSESFLPRLHFNWSELRGLQAGKYHFIDGPKPELYDLESDPQELKNLYAEKQAVAAELRGRLAATIQKYTPAQELAQKTGLDPRLAERLKSLGYAAVAGGGNPTISNRELADPKDRIEVYELVSEAIADSQHGRYDPSIEKLKRALETDKDSTPIHYLLALNYMRKRDFPDAIAELRRVLELSPDYALAVFNLGLAYGGSGDWDQAIQHLKRALELDGTNFSAAFNLGAAYLQKQMWPESLAAFRQSVAIYPDFAPGHRAVGEVLLYQKQVPEALAEL